MLVTQTVECTSDFERDRQPDKKDESLSYSKEQQCCNDARVDAPQQQGVQENDRPCSDAPPVAPVQQQEAQNKTQTPVGAAKTIKISKKTKTNQTPVGGEDFQIPEELKAKLEELSIPKYRTKNEEKGCKG
jgi:hypothetical protein